MEEVLEWRTRNAKRFRNPENHREQRVDLALCAVHWQDGEEWKDINTTPRDEGDELVVDDAPYNLRVQKNTPAFYYESKKGGYYSASLIGSHAPVEAEVVDGCMVYYRDILPDVDIYLLIKPERVEFYKILKAPSARRVFDWDVTESVNGDLGYREKQLGWDAKKRKAQVSNQKIGERTTPDGKEVKYTLREEWTGQISYITDPKTRIREWRDAEDYPVKLDMPNVNENLTAGNRDFWGSVSYNSTGSPFGNSFNNASAYASVFNKFGTATNISYVNFKKSGCFFDGVGIPSGSNVTSATLTLKGCKSVGGSPVNLRCYQIAEDNPTLPTVWQHVLQRAKTTAYDDYVSFNATLTTQSINFNAMTNAVQEVIDRAGWASGNDMSFRCGATPSIITSSGLYHQFYEHASHNGATLSITYVVPGGGPSAGGNIRKSYRNTLLRM